MRWLKWMQSDTGEAVAALCHEEWRLHTGEVANPEDVTRWIGRKLTATQPGVWRVQLYERAMPSCLPLAAMAGPTVSRCARGKRAYKSTCTAPPTLSDGCSKG